MAFSFKSLQPLGATAAGGLEGTSPGNNSTSGWIYASLDSLAMIVTDGYFNEVRDLVNAGDSIWVVGQGPATRITFFDAADKSPSTADVTVSDLGKTMV